MFKIRPVKHKPNALHSLLSLSLSLPFCYAILSPLQPMVSLPSASLNLSSEENKFM
jgi:hypothetical protein